MRESRKNHGLVVVNNRLYAIGGQGAVGKHHNHLTLIVEQPIGNRNIEHDAL